MYKIKGYYKIVFHFVAKHSWIVIMIEKKLNMVVGFFIIYKSIKS